MNDTAPQTHSFPEISRERRTLSHEVAGNLRNEIYQGVLVGGQRLTETRIAADMGVSHGPVREALNILANEGLVALRPYRGAEVLDVTEADFQDVLLSMRVMLEQFAYVRALPRLDRATISQLNGIIEGMHSSAIAGDLDGVVEADMTFHYVVMSMSGEVHAIQLWQTISPRIRLYFHRMGPHHESLDEVSREHIELLDALTSGDANVVKEAIATHVHYPRQSDT